MVLSLSSDPPQRHNRSANHPTLLVSWFCTGCALVIIILRVGGRYVRTERLFKEDKIMFASIIPLFIRMGLVHAILLFGTNNVTTDGLSPQDIHERSIGSKLVLASRMFYAILYVSKRLKFSSISTDEILQYLDGEMDNFRVLETPHSYILESQLRSGAKMYKSLPRAHSYWRNHCDTLRMSTL